MSVGIIGGADGPTSIFLASSMAPMGWISIFGLIIASLLVVPDIVDAFIRCKKQKPSFRVTDVVTCILKYGALYFMIFPGDLVAFAFTSITSFVIYFLGNGILLVSYYVLWLLGLKKPNFYFTLSRNLIYLAIYLICGVTLRRYLLIGAAVLYGIFFAYTACHKQTEQ